VLDDLIEAIEVPAATYALGVQWHPEVDPRSSVVRSLVSAAAEVPASA
jgi:putative glutamine amidotransferase